METLINNVKDVISKANELDAKRKELLSGISKDIQKLKDIFTSRPGWNLFVSKYCVFGDIDDYISPFNEYVYHGLETLKAGNLTISFNGDMVIIEDYITWGYDGHEDWTFEIPIDKFIEFCSSDDYMQKRLDRYKSIKETHEKRLAKEAEERERALYEKLKKKYESVINE